jgi:MFS family permease
VRRLTILIVTMSTLAASAPGSGFAGAWWSETAAGYVGGIGGSLVGLLGALVGILSSRGKARRLVTAIMGAQIVAGLAAVALGLIALSLGQPHHVYSVLVLLGLICAAVNGSLLRTVRRRYEQRELRRIRALDAS